VSAFGIEVAPSTVCIFDGTPSKHDVLDKLVTAITHTGSVEDHEAFRRAVFDREAVMSTGIGSGVAIPHVQMKAVRSATLGVGVCRAGLDFNTLDGLPVNIVVLFAMPATAQREYLRLLAQVMHALKTPGFRERLMACNTPEEVSEALNAFDG